MTQPLSFKNDNDQDERLNPATDTARQLRNQEHEAIPGYDRAGDGLDDHPISAGDASGKASDPSRNIDNTRDQESRGGSWNNKFSGNNTKQKFSLKGSLKKKAPLGLIGLLVGGLGGIGMLLSPSIALMHIKETVVNKFDTMSSVLEQRSVLVMKDRMFGTTVGCKIKVQCKFSGLTQRQMDRLHAQGAKLYDAQGKEITEKNALRRYTGGSKLKLASGEEVSAKDFKLKYFTSPELRSVGRSVYASRFLSFNDKIAQKIRADKKLVTNPKWGEEGDDKSTRKDIHSAVSGESYNTTAEAAPTQNDSNGRPLPPDQQPPDFGPDTQAINEEAARLNADANAGKLVPPLPADAPSVAGMGVSATPTGMMSKVVGFLNPASIAVGLCTTYQLTSALIDATKLIQLSQKMRYATQFLSTSDKLMAGDGSSAEAEKAMTILERPDQYGNTFGDSFSYQYAAYGTVTDTPINSSADGNDTTRLLASTIQWANHELGGPGFLKGACHVITNPWTQGILALTSFIPGPNELFKGALKLVEKGGMEKVTALITSKISKLVEKNLSADALKSAAKTASRDLWQMSKGPLALFMAGYLLERYGVPYLARVISGTGLTGDENGPTAMDTITTGFNAVNASTAQQRGMTPLTKDQYMTYNQFNTGSTATYVADMQAKSNPFDLMNPYSTGNAMASAYYMFSSKLNAFRGGSFNLLSAPAAILSNLSPGRLLSSPSLADANQTQASLNYCPDSYLQSHNLATTPDCSVIYGFNDINMLKNTDPTTGVTKWMLDNNQIDGDGNPLPGSAFADFQSKCIDGSDMKSISDVGNPDSQLDPECYDPAKNNSTEFKMFRLYNIDNGVNDGMDNGASKATGSTTATATTAPTGSAQSLAQQIISSPNIRFQTPAEKTLFQTIVDTGKQTLIKGPSPIDGGPVSGCDGTTQVPISPSLLSVILAASKQYKITIGVVAAGHDCDGAYHPQGRALDINGVAHLDQPFVQSYTWSGGQVAMAQEFYQFLDKTAGQSGIRLELGQKGCFGNTPPQLSNTKLVSDSCNHIHIGVVSP